MEYKQEFEKPLKPEDFYKKQLEQAKWTLNDLEKRELTETEKDFVIDKEEAINILKDNIAYFEDKLNDLDY